VANVEHALCIRNIFEKYQKQILYVVGGLILVVLVSFGHSELLPGTTRKAAENEMFKAQLYFEQDSFSSINVRTRNLWFKRIVSDMG
jgi:hypothetical protein